ncbi:MAG: sigma-54-dependent Fis family transcriptional regulator [Bacteroidales bacterium]|nr:sigma-54-dependent Fis family transcriptional regulator [Bacteroidales bacterium]
MNSPKRVLVVDDEAAIRRNISDLLTPIGYDVAQSGDGHDALQVFMSHKPQVVIVDINLPRKDGLSLLKDIKKMDQNVPVIVFTAFGTSERAIEAMKLGAFDYIEKPFEIDEFVISVERASEYYNLLLELSQLRSIVRESKSGGSQFEIIGRNFKMQEIFKLIGRLAPTDATVLIQGESGTGKELIADAIQRHSLRSGKPYVKINCGALSESVLESEIFGHEKGSFTGADARRQGLFEIADGGTVYLDEINSMPKSLQVRLLRILQKQSFFRVGGVTPVTVDVRVIASSNRDVELEVGRGELREDLYYRLNVVRINIPPLRDRADDINHLIDYFLHKYRPDKDMVISPASRRRLNSYKWPGNIRELENVIYSALVTSSDRVLEIKELPVQSTTNETSFSPAELIDTGMSFKEAIHYVEKQIIEEALRRHNNNQSRAAEYLRINRRLLYSKIKDLKL